MNIVGGCCGDHPRAHRAVVQARGPQPPSPARRAWSPASPALYQAVSIRQDNKLFDRRRADQANGSRSSASCSPPRTWTAWFAWPRSRSRPAATMIDVCGAYVGRDELADMRRIVSRFATEVPVPLMIDSTEAPVIEASLETGRRQVHRPTASTWKTARSGATTSCPSAASSGPPCRSHHRRRGHGQDRDRKVAIARRIYRLATEKTDRPRRPAVRSAHVHHLHRQRGRPQAGPGNPRGHPPHQAGDARLPHCSP